MLDSALAEQYFNQLYGEINGYSISNKARTEAGLTVLELEEW